MYRKPVRGAPNDCILNIKMTTFHALVEASLAVLRHHSLIAAFILIVIEDCGAPIPLPGNMLLLYLGYRISIGRAALFPTLLAMTMATWVGSMLLYGVMTRLGRPALHRYGRYIGLEPARVIRIEGWLDRYGACSVVIGRCFPGLRNPTSAIAGAFGVRGPVFALYSWLSSLVWTGCWLLAGALIGQRVPIEVGHMAPSHIIGAVVFFATLFLALPAIGYVNILRERVRLRRRAKTACTQEEGPAGINVHHTVAPAERQPEPIAHER